MFDLLFTREWDEITEKYGDKRYKNLGFAKIEGRVLMMILPLIIQQFIK